MKLFNRNFSLMVVGQIVSIFGAAILRFALSTYVLDMTGRADLFAIVFAVSTIPGIVLSPIGGAIADRFNRRNLMVFFDFSSCAIVLASIFLLINNEFNIVLVGIIMTLLTTISFFYQPAVQASIPTLQSSENLEKANGVVTGVSSLSNIMGPVLGGILYGLFGINALLYMSCGAFFLSAVMETFIHIPFEKRSRDSHIVAAIFKDLKDGTRFITKERPFILKVMIIAALMNLFLVPFFIIGVPYILRVTMASSESLLGIGLGIVQLSSILGALSIGLFAKKLKIPTVYIWIGISGLLFIPMAVALLPQILGLGFAPSFSLFLTFAVPVMMIATMLSIYVITIIQRETPNELLGKVMALITAIAQCAAPVGQILYGSLLEGFSNSVYIPTLLICVLIMVIAVVSRVLLKSEKELIAQNL